MKEVRSERFKGERNPMFGKPSPHRGVKPSNETIAKMREKAKPVKQLDDKGNLIKIWRSVKEAADYFGMGFSNIANVLNKKMRNISAAGFRWEWEHEPNIKYLNMERFSKCQKFYKIWRIDNIDDYILVINIREFCEKREAMKYCNFADILRGRRKVYKGLFIKEIAKEEFLKLEKIDNSKVEI